MRTKTYVEIRNRLAELRHGRDEGAALAEYGLLVVGIAMIALAGVYVFGDEVSGLFEGLSLP